MSSDADSAAPREPAAAAPASAPTLRGYLRGPAGIGLIVLLYLIVGGLAWLVIQSQGLGARRSDYGQSAPGVQANPCP